MALNRSRVRVAAVAALVAAVACGDDVVAPSASAETTLSAGGTFTCRLGDGGAAECWGTNWWGQLGEDTQERCSFIIPGFARGTSPCSRLPVPVAAGLRFSTIVLSMASSPWAGHICGITGNKALFCWGVDKTQLGVELISPEVCVSINGLVGQPCSREPVAVEPNQAFAGVATGDFHTCGLAADGAVFCWGSDDNGQLGSTDSEMCGEFDLPCSFRPVAISSTARFVSLAAGALHTCALATDGVPFCWGNNDWGQLGHQAPLGRNVPSAAGGRGFVALSAGRDHTCGLTSDGSAYCWGNNESGQLGNGAAVPSAPQGRVTASRPFFAISAGWDHTCGITVGGEAYCWGSNLFGQLGVETTGNRNCPVAGGCSVDPVPVESDLRFTAVAAGGVHTCAVATDGITYCWGDNSLGQLGDSVVTRSLAPVPVGS